MQRAAFFALENHPAERHQKNRTDMENLVGASMREKEMRLHAEFQQHRAAQMEYMEKRMHELVTQSTHEVVAEVLLKLNATGKSANLSAVSEIVATFQENKARQPEKAIADLALKVEVAAASSVQPADLKCVTDVLRAENDELKGKTHAALGLVEKEIERIKCAHGISHLQQQFERQKVAHEHAMREKQLQMELLEQRIQTLERAALTPSSIFPKPPSIHLNCAPAASAAPTVVNVATTFANATPTPPVHTQPTPSAPSQGKYRLRPLAVTQGSSSKETPRAAASGQSHPHISVQPLSQTHVQAPAETRFQVSAPVPTQTQPSFTHQLLTAAVMNSAAPTQPAPAARQVMTIGSSLGHGVPPPPWC